MKNNKITIANLPNAGLGNMLFIWARAKVFSKINDTSFYISRFSRIKIGPYLRFEKNKRFYFFYFISDSFINRLKYSWVRFFTICRKEYNPDLKIVPQKHVQYIFSKMPENPLDSFEGLKNYRELISESLMLNLRRRVKDKLNNSETPVIALHIRRGDFKYVSWGQTPDDFFIAVVQGIRRITKKSLPVTIFSDGSSNDLKNILELPNTKLADSNPDIVDMLLMSKAKVLIISTGSTFSYWSAFLGNMPVIWHPNNNHFPMRPDKIREKYFEGPIKSLNSTKWSNILVENLKIIDE